MSANCKSLLPLLQRCVAVRQLPVTAAIKTRSSVLSRAWWNQNQQRAWISDTTTVRHLQPGLRIIQHRFCTKAGSPCEEDYPPLPDYQTNSQPQTKEVYLVQVKGLLWSCTAQDLLQFFSDCRIRDGENGIHLPLDRLGRPSGRAFIEMEHEEDVRKALEKHRQYLGPRYVEVYEVTNSDAEEILQKSTEPRSEDDAVLLRGLPFSCNEDDVARFFSGFNIAEDGITMVTNSRGRNSGQAYVQFSSQQEAKRALQKDRELIGHRYIEVFPSSRKEVQTALRKMRTIPNPNPPQYANWRPVPDSQPNYRAASHQMSHAPTHYIHVRGLPFHVTGEDIVKFFSPLVVSKILVEFGPSGRPSGEADVFFRCHRDALDAMSRDRMNMGQRYIELFLNSVPDS
ncbi:heterogeneous nuclear ribonucleoprotein H2-like [Xiphophorus maculatus]|uniref:G-rich RNA sequence binding factor 1 n=1 Tax=Xiphophorus maculatus TaxID=8083 RepID=A0A3B5QD16_XIPMA|nr:heterogeneous nuclear ribonucleoprotein H2-like [Xiphophorus maculatus]XP_023199354.1 heterogeneous nuclear ribonucleoprotein H2-like [Xiphophorus maculatus]XP_023199355.1 heterogeneous nuclear ribonucleoprotein H2-like [Xiphophorus maculatus]